MDFSRLCNGIGVGASLPEVHQPLYGLIATSPQEVGMTPHLLTTYLVSPCWYIYVLVEHEGGSVELLLGPPTEGTGPWHWRNFCKFYLCPDSHCSIWKLGFKMLDSMLVEPVRRMAMYRRDKAFWVLALKCRVSHWLNLFEDWNCLDWRKCFEFSSLVHTGRKVGKWVGT
jgi:hypothetical protein